MNIDSPCTSTSSDCEKLEIPPDPFPLDSTTINPPVPNPTCSRKLSTKKRHERPAACAVCGQPASGYHYEVASCNGCKTFFRRVLLSERSFVCKMNKDCFDLTKRETPIKCRACRYSKCVKVGMNPLAMKLDEPEAQTENFKKLSKRVIQVDDKDEKEEIVVIEEPGPSKTLVKMIFSADEKKQKMLDMLTYLEYKIEMFRKCAYNPKPESLPCLETLLQENNKISLADRIGPMSGWPLEQPKEPREKREPNQEKNGPKKTLQHYNPQKRMWFLFDLLTTVEYAKTFEFFNKLDLKDRILLLRNVALVIMNLHVSHFSIQNNFDTVIHPDGIIPSQGISLSGVIYGHCKMTISPLVRYGVSSKEFMLLKAICLCNPAVPDLSKHAQDILLAEREIYASALFDHCLQDSKLGPSHFAHLIGIIDTLEHQQKIQKDLHILVMLPITRKFEPVPLIESIMDD